MPLPAAPFCLTCSGCLPLLALLFAYLLGGRRVASQEIITKLGICSSLDGGTQASGEAQHEMDIVDGAKSVVELFLGPDEMMNIRSAIVTTGIAIAALLNRTTHRAETR